jgi:hypothetical protein
MILLSDNDLVVKLAQCDLLDVALDSFESQRSECFVLSTIRHSLRLGNPDKSIERYVGSPQAFERINEFLEHCNVLPEAPILDLIDHLVEIPEIDVGEQALFLHAKENHDKNLSYLMLTGDKRALRAICVYDQLDAFEFLRTKVVCLESCMMDMIDHAGFDHINEKVSAARPQVAEEKYDKVLRAAFGKDRNQDHCLDCLRHYCSDIRWLLSY